MQYRPQILGWLGAAVGILWVGAGHLVAQAPWLGQGNRGGAAVAQPACVGGAPTLPYEELPAGVREQVRQVLEHPTLHTRGAAEAFNCQPAMYYWLLDHPDRAATVWRRLGAKCIDMQDRGGGRFGWSDGQGSDVHWDTIHTGPRQRVWYAEGKVRPALLSPAVPFQAVVVLHYAEGKDADGKPVLRHQAELTLHTDSKSAALVARILGSTAPHLAEQYVSQLQMFFAALAWYLDQHPEKAATLLAGVLPAAQPGQ